LSTFPPENRFFAPLLPLIEDSLSLSHGQAGGLYSSLAVATASPCSSPVDFLCVGHKKTVVSGLSVSQRLFCSSNGRKTTLPFHGNLFSTGVALETYLPPRSSHHHRDLRPKVLGKAIGLHDSAASFSLFKTPVRGVRSELLFMAGPPALPGRSLAPSPLPLLEGRLLEPMKLLPRKGRNMSTWFRKESVWVLGYLWIVSSCTCAGVFNILPLTGEGTGTISNTPTPLLGILPVGGIFATIVFGLLCDRYGRRRGILMILI